MQCRKNEIYIQIRLYTNKELQVAASKKHIRLIGKLLPQFLTCYAN